MEFVTFFRKNCIFMFDYNKLKTVFSFSNSKTSFWQSHIQTFKSIFKRFSSLPSCKFHACMRCGVRD